MRTLLVACAALAFAGLPAAAQVGSAGNDYPTQARAEYVFACMAVNGQTREVLERCACSIDVVASIVPHEEYVEAEAVLAMRQTSGERVSLFRNAEIAKTVVEDLRRAQAEGEVRCF